MPSSTAAPEAVVDGTPATAAHRIAPATLAGERRHLAHAGHRIAVYLSARCLQRDALHEAPLLLVHGVHAAASAADVRPLFEHYAARRPVLALELPGFGASDRVDRPYDPALMGGAVLAALDHLQSLGFEAPADVMAVSMSCEFVARVALEQPQRLRSVALVSPTGLEGWRREAYADGATAHKPWLLALLRCPLWSAPLFKAMTSRASLRRRLRRAWGSQRIDERLLDDAHASARQPGARHAPLAAASGALLTRGVTALYRALALPVWLAHGSHGAHADCDGVQRLGPRAHWRRDRFETGTLPYFEAMRDFGARYDAFLAPLHAPTVSVQPPPRWGAQPRR